MNTGRVGGAESVEGSKKVKIQHSSAIVKGIAEGTIEWERDPDFGYLVAAHVPGIDAADPDVLQPRRLYEATGRMDEYGRHVEQFKRERSEYLSAYASLSSRDRQRGSLTRLGAASTAVAASAAATANPSLPSASSENVSPSRGVPTTTARIASVLTKPIAAPGASGRSRCASVKT